MGKQIRSRILCKYSYDNAQEETIVPVCKHKVLRFSIKSAQLLGAQNFSTLTKLSNVRPACIGKFIVEGVSSQRINLTLSLRAQNPDNQKRWYSHNKQRYIVPSKWSADLFRPRRGEKHSIAGTFATNRAD